MAETIYVYVDLHGKPQFVGRLWAHSKGKFESATFEYDRAWLTDPRRFSLEPALKLVPGPVQTAEGKAIFGSFGDSAPDRWGRMLIKRAARMQASETHSPLQYLREVDYLLAVNDEARMGALRFSQVPDGPFLAEKDRGGIPLEVNLPTLLKAADLVNSETESTDDLRLLLAPGSSLGGARPKASVRIADDVLAVAKFPHKNDDYDTVTWEAVALTLASRSGIRVPDTRITMINGRPVLILNRFDRNKNIRIPFLSAMSMLGATDHEQRSYLELVDALKRYGAHPDRDILELWRRIVFSVLVSNVDDHLRNHGFLYTGTDGWVLSPAYDINPTPADIAPRILSTSIGIDDPTASLEIALEYAEYFGLSKSVATSIVKEVFGVVSTWRSEAKRYGMNTSELERMASAFEHDDYFIANKL